MRIIALTLLIIVITGCQPQERKQTPTLLVNTHGRFVKEEFAGIMCILDTDTGRMWKYALTPDQKSAALYPIYYASQDGLTNELDPK